MVGVAGEGGRLDRWSGVFGGDSVGVRWGGVRCLGGEWLSGYWVEDGWVVDGCCARKVLVRRWWESWGGDF